MGREHWTFLSASYTHLCLDLPQRASASPVGKVLRDKGGRNRVIEVGSLACRWTPAKTGVGRAAVSTASRANPKAGYEGVQSWALGPTVKGVHDTPISREPSLWVFCNYQFVLLHPFTLLAHPLTPSHLSPSPPTPISSGNHQSGLSLCLWVCLNFVCSFILFLKLIWSTTGNIINNSIITMSAVKWVLNILGWSLTKLYNVQSLDYTPETNIILYINYNQKIKKIFQKKERQHGAWQPWWFKGVL